jgi:putative tryptophan/tyrosine transport system substrate-binding protein
MSAFGVADTFPLSLFSPNSTDQSKIIKFAPEVTLATGSIGAELMVKATRTIPIVFVVAPDPVGSGFVKRLSRPKL